MPGWSISPQQFRIFFWGVYVRGGGVGWLAIYCAFMLNMTNEYTPGPSKGCQLNPKGWWIDTLQEPFGTPLKVLEGCIGCMFFLASKKTIFHPIAKILYEPPRTWRSSLGRRIRLASVGGTTDVWHLTDDKSQSFIRILIIMVMIVMIVLDDAHLCCWCGCFSPSWSTAYGVCFRPSSSVRLWPLSVWRHWAVWPITWLMWSKAMARTMSTPLKTNMEPKHGGVLQMIFLLKGVIFSWTSRQFWGVKEELRKPMLCPGSSAPQSPLDEVDGLGWSWRVMTNWYWGN